MHLFISQLHLAFLRAHNGTIHWLREDGVSEDSIFEEADHAPMPDGDLELSLVWGRRSRVDGLPLRGWLRHLV